MSDISTGQIFTPGQQGINAPQMNNIIGLAAINSSFISTKNPITNLQNNDNFILARNDGSWARITGAALADGLVNAEPNFARIAVGPIQTQCPIINGDMQIWQRGTSFTSLGPSAHTKINDKWVNDAGGAMTGRATISQQLAGITGTSNYPDTEYCLRITVTTSQASLAAGDVFVAGQFVEQQLARVLYDNPTSLSLLLRCSITGTFCVSLRNNNAGTSNRSYVIDCPVTSANVWQRFAFPAIATMPTGSGTWGTSDTDYSYILAICAGGGTTYQTTSGAWQTGNFVADSNQTNLFATNGATLDIALVQHEAGNVCTPFYWTPFDVSLSRCKRYYQQSFPYGTYPGAVSVSGGLWVATCVGTSDAFGVAEFSPSLRSSPSTINAYSPITGTVNRVRDLTSAVDITVSNGNVNQAATGFTDLQSSAAYTSAHIVYANWMVDVDY